MEGLGVPQMFISFISKVCGLLTMIRTLKAVLKLLRGSNDVEAIYNIEDGLRNTRVMQFSVRYMLAQPGVAAIALSQYIAPRPYIEVLKFLPPGTFGREYAEFITKHGFDPNFYRKVGDLDNVTSYLLLRMRQSHDLWHVVTGFDVSVPGEIGLKAFELAQTRRPMAGALVAGAFIRCFFQNPNEVNSLLSAIAKGYRTGLNAEPFLAQKWEEYWELPLDQLRAELGVNAK
jgi:ubiquinone biosynthesis protein COQ4